jgi:hypothetical protein
MIITIFTTLLLCGIDNILEKYNILGRYYFNHFLINFIITYITFDDVILSYTDFNNTIYKPINIISVELAFSIHFYHIIIYYNKFLFDDWLHHIIMIFIALPLGIYVRCGYLIGHSLFFLTGLPGGINYLLLFLQRNNLIDRKTQKYYNYSLNLYIRQPGTIATSVIGILSIFYFDFYIFEKIFLYFIIISHYWNGIYFMEQVIRNYNLLYQTV